jgi:hypothetical protein
MARNGSGTYNLLTNSWNPATNGNSATAVDWQNLINDVAAALTQSLSADGQTPMTGNLNAGNNKITELAAGSATGDSLRWEQLFSQGQPANLASAATTDIGAQNTVLLNITGTTTITSFGTNYNGPRYLRFDGILTLTHNATTLILPGGANITTAAGDSAIVVPNGTPANGWRVLGYERADGANNATSKIQPISATITSNQIIVSASALTLDFRSTTLTSGTVTTVIGTPANLTIASTDSFGLVTASGNQRIAILAINNAGTIELAAASLFGSQSLDETGVITTVTAATTSAQIKSATARTNVAYRVIGFVDATFTTGTGWGSLTVVQGAGGQALAAMSSLGYGQTWQDVAGSRAMQTTYYNTTNKPITVIVSCFTTTNSTAGFTVSVGGLVLSWVQVTDNNGANYQAMRNSLTFVVQPGASYSADSVTTAVTIGNWTELR